jgi:ubiquinone/menaquinone biosynthesis C-methylase UbiE
MSNEEIRKSFDEISRVYDATRDPLLPATVDRVARELRRAGVHSILEIGVGTGRIARPLTDAGFEVTGADLSLGMLGRARRKKLDRLVRASGYRLPFAPRTFDATLMVHVLHMLDRPGAVLREAARVSRLGTFALVNPRRGSHRRPKRPREESIRNMLSEILAESGHPMKPLPGGLPRRERRVLERLPPDSMRVVEERDVTVSLASQLDRLGKGGHRPLLRVPRKELRRAVRIAKRRVGDRTVTSHRVMGLALWRADRRRGGRASARSGAPSRTAGRRPRGSSRAPSRSGSRTARRTGSARRSAASR